MKFTKDRPKVPGAYWYRRKGEQDTDKKLKVVYLCKEHKNRDETVEVLRVLCSEDSEGQNRTVSSFDGEWCGPLVPVEEVEKAWNEAYTTCCERFLLSDKGRKICYKNSNARRVVEGEV